jgi:hypothetical protein
MPRVSFVFVLVTGMSLFAAAAQASCVVTNQTGYEFVVSSGNAPNQKVAAHATTTIEAGKISGKSPEGRTISGSCKEGARLVVVEKNGVPLLLPKK